MKRVLVTGGSGKLGSYVVAELKSDYETIVLDRVRPRHDVAWVEADMLERESLRPAFRELDAVVHLAALDDVVDASDEEFLRVNTMGLWNVLLLAEALEIPRFVHCSSVAAVEISRDNPPQRLPVPVDHPGAPVSAYGISKLVGEQLTRAVQRRSNLEIVCLRPALVMQDDFAYSLGETTARADGGPLLPDADHPEWERIDEAWPGSRSFVTPMDAARCFRAALEAEPMGYSTFFVAAADSYSPLPTLDVVEREFGGAPANGASELYERDPRASMYDIETTVERIGWRPRERWSEVVARLQATAESKGTLDMRGEKGEQ